MNFIQFKSEKPETIFAPWWFYIIGEDRLINIDFKKIASLILEKESIILFKYFLFSIKTFNYLSKNFIPLSLPTNLRLVNISEEFNLFL